MSLPEDTDQDQDQSTPDQSTPDTQPQSAPSAPAQDAGPAPPSLTDVLAGQPQQPATPDLPAQTPATAQYKPGFVGRLLGGLEGFAIGGVPGAIGGVANPRLPARAIQDARTETANEQQMQASKVRFANTQSAQAAVSLATEQFNLSRLPIQARLQAEASDRATEDNFDKLGLQPVAAGPAGKLDSILRGAYAEYSKPGEDGVPNLRVIHSEGGMVKVYDVSDMGSSDGAFDVLNKNRDDRNLPPITKADFNKMGQTPAGAVKRQALVDGAVSFWAPKATGKDADNLTTLAGLKSSRDAYIARTGAGADNPTVQKYNKTITDFTAQTNAQANLKDRDMKTALANKAAQQAAAKAAQAGSWNPGTTADEKKKAELAENIAENTNQIGQILVRRPDLLGPAAGRFTAVQQMIGNNDPDIAKLGISVHNLAMANSGVHGFRSQEGVESTEKMILNGFKNGPQSIAGALRGLTTSTQTFIDNARPDNYKTHSKQGGALKGMGKQ
jgi:hypothetical protein